MSGSSYKLQSDECRSILVSGLSTHEHRSVSVISSLTGLSSRVVTDTLNRLMDIGLPIQPNVRGELKLLRQIVPVNEDAVRNIVAITNQHLALKIVYLPETDSTNEYLLRLPASHAVHQTVCIAEYMSTGRGRRGRFWHCGAFENIMLSMAWTFDDDRRYFPGLSLAVAVMVVRVLQQACNVKFQVKWPNDILWNGKKIGGILIEIRDSTAVIGLGLNCRLSDEDRISIVQPAAALGEIPGIALERSQLTGALIIALNDGLEQYTREGLRAFGDEWMRFHAHSGKKVRADEGDAVTGTITGIDDEGALMIRTDNGVLTSVRSGGIELLE